MAEALSSSSSNMEQLHIDNTTSSTSNNEHFLPTGPTILDVSYTELDTAGFCESNFFN